MSTLEVNKITPVSGGSTVQVGESGDTINIPAGATIANAGTATGFGVSLANGADNRVVTASSASALNGEANATFDGTQLNLGGDTDAGYNPLQLGSTSDSHAYIQMLGSVSGQIHFGDSTSGNAREQGVIQYRHDEDLMKFKTNNTEAMRIKSNKNISIGSTSNEARLDVRLDNNQVGVLINNTKSSGVGETTLIAMCSQDTSNSSYLLFQCRNGGGLVMKVLDSGNIQNANNSYGSTSDERIKQNISDASSQWEDIKALKIRKFKKKKDVNRDGADNTPYHLGVIAQELEASGMNGLVEESNPQEEDVALHSDFGTVVSGTADNGATPITDEEGNITGYKNVFTEGQKVKEVKYSVLYMKSVKALQEAMTRIETLEAKVAALESA